ncbi:MAG: phosphate/phosphite/phosphonate ABC transporter substrate-binding protein, partial [Magnetococcus sp. YQC-5]
DFLPEGHYSVREANMFHILLSVYCLSVWILLTCVTTAQATSLIMGSISNEPAVETRLFAPVARYLAKQLASQEITNGDVVVAANIKEMVEYLKNRQVDFYLESPMSSIVINHLAGSKMTLRRWKKGHAEYRSVIFVKQQSPIQNLAQLAGKRIGFKDPYSSSGYILPRIAMKQAGLQLMQLPDARAKVPEDKTGYVFNNDDENTIVWVLHGRIDAGAMGSTMLDDYAKGDLNKLRIIHETFSIPRHVVNLRKDFPDHLEQPLLKAFLEMDQNPEGKAILEAFEKTKRFDHLPNETHEQLQQITPTVLEIMDVKP